MTSFVPDSEARAKEVRVTADELIVVLHDGRRLAVPLDWLPRLQRASEGERNQFELLGGGLGIHWPALDEDLSVRGLLLGIPSRSR